MSKRTLGDDIEDHYYGTQGVYTEGVSNQIGLDEHNRKLRNQNLNNNHHEESNSSSVPASVEEVIANIIGWVIFLGGCYYGIYVLNLDWYWPVGVSLVVSIVMHKLLIGPMYFLLKLIKWALQLALIVGLFYLCYLGYVIYVA